MNPIVSFELLFFAVFGQTTTDQTQVDKIPPIVTRTQPEETDYLFKIVFGIYMLVSVVVLINLLIAMMSDTYQRIQVFRNSRKIINVHQNQTRNNQTSTPPPQKPRPKKLFFKKKPPPLTTKTKNKTIKTAYFRFLYLYST